MKRAVFKFFILIFLILPGAFAVAGAGEKYAFTPHFTSAEGELALLEQGKNGRKYVLLIRVGTGVFPFFYVAGDPETLRRWKGRNVKISGSLFWKKSLDRPVLKLDKLEPAWRTHF